MLIGAALLVGLGVLPVGLYLWREHKLSTPSLQWPVLARILGLRFEDAPPRLSGSWNGRPVRIEALSPSGARASAALAAPTRLRVECGDKELVSRRAGMVVPDRVEPLAPEFRERLLARCSDKAAGPTVFDQAMQHRLALMPDVDLVGQGNAVTWTLPALRDPDTAEAVLGALCAVADALEGYPEGGRPHA